jgi:isoquinoline 1-oxidoreductase beta subunit
MRPAMESAATQLEAIYQVPFLAHAAMEPMNCTVHVRKDSCEVWVGTQVLSRAQEAAAKTAGLPLEKVTVHNHLLGGGFGRRLEIDGVIRAVQIAKQVDGPVKVIWTRERTSSTTCTGRTSTTGSPPGWTRTVCPSPGVIASPVPRFWGAGCRRHFKMASMVKRSMAQLNLPTHCRTFWSTMCAMNHRAFRPRSGAASAPRTTSSWSRVSSMSWRRWRRKIPSRIDARCSTRIREREQCSTWPLRKRTGAKRCLQVSAVACQCSSPSVRTYMAQVAEVKVASDGAVQVQRVACAVDCGIVVNPDTVRAQVQSAIIFGITGALYGEVTFKDGRVEQANFHNYRVLRMNERPMIDIHLVEAVRIQVGWESPERLRSRRR